MRHFACVNSTSASIFVSLVPEEAVALFSRSAPCRRHFKHSPSPRREVPLQCAHFAGSFRILAGESVRPENSMILSCESRESCTQISDFLVDVGSILNGLCDLLPKECSVTRSEFVHQPLDDSRRDTQDFGEMPVGYLRPVGGQILTQGFVC